MFAQKETTPMMAQYLSAKMQHPDCILLFRMGDFYEMFFDDAKKASAVLGIALTQRGKHLSEDIPMCGVPVSTLDNYVSKLVKSGEKIAICEQVEDVRDAKKRGHKAVVKREITRILTAGTIIEDNLLAADKNNYLMAIVPCVSKKTQLVSSVSFSIIDISTNDFFVHTCHQDSFLLLMETYKPKEILVPLKFENSDFVKILQSRCDAIFTVLSDSKFNPIVEKERLEKYFNVKTIDSFEIKESGELSSCGAVLEYLLITQKDNLSTLSIPKKITSDNRMIIDAATSRSLEIMSSNCGEYRFSLLGALNNTKTAFGARALASRVASPITEKHLLERRLDFVEYFLKNTHIKDEVKKILSKCPDFERSISRIKFNKFSPRDINDIRSSINAINDVKQVHDNIMLDDAYSTGKLADFSQLSSLLAAALSEKLPAINKEGELIASGYSEKLDQLRYMKEHSKDMMLDLQSRYISETEINTLKIKNNAIIGWYVEIPLSQKSKIPEQFIHRQTLVTGIRYTTEELISLQNNFMEAFEEYSKLEQQLYVEVIGEILKYNSEICYAVQVMALLDIYVNLADIAIERNYCRPSICEEPILEIENGRHPVLSLLEKDFIENDCDLTQHHRICLLTGPNMAGKSTYLRQNALIVVMAQIGCYVPAQKATIGIVDRLFSRIGASDDIARGRSTFMVEMIETATILNQATEKSFVILDEVGRGTSTYDGLSIAWAVIESLYNINRCRVLFATHYRELTVLQISLENIRCKTLKVQEWNGEVVFYHKIIDGIADKSYGIYVAAIAGVPKCVIKRASALLKLFERQQSNQLSMDYVLCEQMKCCADESDKPNN